MLDTLTLDDVTYDGTTAVGGVCGALGVDVCVRRRSMGRVKATSRSARSTLTSARNMTDAACRVVS
jgi:hypothetical protein